MLRRKSNATNNSIVPVATCWYKVSTELFFKHKVTLRYRRRLRGTCSVYDYSVLKDRFRKQHSITCPANLLYEPRHTLSIMVSRFLTTWWFCRCLLAINNIWLFDWTCTWQMFLLHMMHASVCSCHNYTETMYELEHTGTYQFPWSWQLWPWALLQSHDVVHTSIYPI